jgi:hypothetical protein
MLQNNSERPKWDEVAHLSTKVKAMWAIWSDLVIESGILYRKPTKKQISKYPQMASQLQLVTPQAIQLHLFALVHQHKTGGHLGNYKTISRLKRYFWWPGYTKDIKLWCKECLICQQVKTGLGRKHAILKQLPVGFTLERVAADIIGPLPETKKGNKYILVIMDYFTKWAEAIALSDQTAVTVADAFVTEFICRLGCPQQFHSDQGPCFRAQVLQQVCELLEIYKTQTTPYHPQSDGLVEKFNGTLQNMLKTVTKERMEDWDEALPYVMMAYRSTPQESTGCSPNLLMLGREVISPLELLYPPLGEQKKQYQCATEYTQWLKHIMEQSHEIARQHLQSAAVKQKRTYDLGSKPRTLQRGQWVLLLDHVEAKMKPMWKAEPHLVLQTPLEGEVIVQVQAAPDAEVKTVHIDHVKILYGCTKQSWLEEYPETIYRLQKLFKKLDKHDQSKALKIIQQLLIRPEMVQEEITARVIRNPRVYSKEENPEVISPQPQTTRSGRVTKPVTRY